MRATGNPSRNIILFWDNSGTGLFRLSFTPQTTIVKTTYTPAYQMLLQMLIEARRAAALSQMDVASSLGKPQSFVSKYERGERRLDAVELVTICKQIGLSPHQVIDELISQLS